MNLNVFFVHFSIQFKQITTAVDSRCFILYGRDPTILQRKAPVCLVSAAFVALLFSSSSMVF